MEVIALANEPFELKKMSEFYTAYEETDASTSTRVIENLEKERALER